MTADVRQIVIRNTAVTNELLAPADMQFYSDADHNPSPDESMART
jgi:hypothetical protein